MHPDAELREKEPIDQSVAQAALAALNALIEMYSRRRFFAGQEWELDYGFAQVPAGDVVQLSQRIGEKDSVLVSKVPAKNFRSITFELQIPPDAIFNFLYNYESLDRWRALRIEARARSDRKGRDNGILLCSKWHAWVRVGKYTTNSEPNPKERRHTMKVMFDPPGAFVTTVDGVQLALESPADWEFDPQGKIGFMAELGPMSLTNVVVKAR